MPIQPNTTSIEELDAPSASDEARTCIICGFCRAPEELDAATSSDSARVCGGICAICVSK